MAYSQGSIIAAADYNTLINGANQLNTVWATGTGNVGYGQSAISTVASSGTVTASQWATLINRLNSIKTHQSGAGTGISATTAGSTVNFISTLQANVDSAYTNRTSFTTQGTTVTGSTFSPALTNATTQSALTYTVIRTITFQSGDQARYFFNCGGQINLVSISATNNDATSRSGDIVTMIHTNFGGLTALRSATNGGRTGTGGTLTTGNTAIGYQTLTTANVTPILVTSTTANYTNDTFKCDVKSNGVQGANADHGNVITISCTIFSASSAAYAVPAAIPVYVPAGTPPVNNASVNESVNVTWNHRIDIVPPEVTNLTLSWGNITVT